MIPEKLDNSKAGGECPQRGEDNRGTKGMGRDAGGGSAWCGGDIPGWEGCQHAEAQMCADERNF